MASSEDIINSLLAKETEQRRSVADCIGVRSEIHVDEGAESLCRPLQSSRPSAVRQPPDNNDSHLERLGNIMERGFQNLQTSFGKLGGDIANQITENLRATDGLATDDGAGSDYADLSETQHESEDLFTSLSRDFLQEETLGPEVPASLASLVNTVLSKQSSDDSSKVRYDSYLRPKNLEFAEAPKTNKPIWESLNPGPRRTDLRLQGIQKAFLKSSVPITEVMNSLFSAVHDPQSVDFADLIKRLTNSLSFLGDANLQMVQLRRDFIKKELPEKVRPICNSDLPFSSMLFGEDFLSKLKDIQDLHRITGSLRHLPELTRGPGRFRAGRRGGRFMRGQPSGRFSPYNRRLNGRRPSKRRH